MALFFNQATLSYSGKTVNSNITTGEILEVLTANKTAVINEYSVGTDLTYAINIINSGSNSFTGLTVTDDLGAFPFSGETLQPLDYEDGSLRYFINGILQSAPAVTAGPPLVVSGISVPAGGTATILYAAKVNDFASPLPEGTIENTAVISGNGIAGPITVTETVTGANGAFLELIKTVSPTTISESGQITYTFVIQNTGNEAADATDNTVITDIFDPILSNITVTYNGTVWNTPESYTYNQNTGEFSTVSGAITVPAATYQQNSETGVWEVTPGSVTLTVSGTL